MSTATKRFAIALMVTAGGCDILSPQTTLEVVNETGVILEVLAAPCGIPLSAFAVLADGERHNSEIEPGCWTVQGITNDGRAATIQLQVKDGTLRRVPFRPDDGSRGGGAWVTMRPR